MQNVLPDLRSAKDFVTNATSTSNSFIGSTASTILTDMTAGKRSSTVSISGKSVNDVRYLLGTLNQGGYNAQLTTAGIQISW